LNGRNFSGQAVQAYIADGTQRFKKSSERTHALDEDDEKEEKKRLDEFGSWIEKQEDS
jgi:HIV Tat-specific factor 1